MGRSSFIPIKVDPRELDLGINVNFFIIRKTLKAKLLKHVLGLWMQLSGRAFIN